ncbi:uncharacterized protein LOC100680479 [Nasonia vitripennis]|uniref:Chitin-binding type-2 domain-containing protein n=1 Tax=Nasonia vitripennis TaxID=7425 RepID=A0A7M7TA73_NASVI|nr:uncharacterized protein LOC100680479 [Nasonia vitripennis]
MKVITIVAILGLVKSGSAYYEPKCPGNNSGKTILLPNFEDCTSYFTCRNGYPIINPCPNGQHFNPRKLKCTDPEEAKCMVTTTTQKPTTTTSATTPTPTPTTTTTTTTTITPKPTPSDPVKCPAPNGSGDIVLLPNPKNCTTYFRCREGLPITTLCPEGMHFDPRNLICAYPDEAGCEVTTTTAKPVTCPPDNKPIKLPNPYDCSTYYSCIKGVPNLTSCPNGLHFNPVELECDFPEDAGCEVFPTTTPEPTTTTPKPTTTTPEPTTTTPVPTTTTAKATTTTPEPTTTTPEPTTTTPKPTTTTREPTTTTPKPTTTTPEPTTTTPVPTTTTQKPTTTTPEPTTTTPEPTTTTPKSTEIPVTCSVQGELIPNPKDCGSYYQCSNGRPWLMLCPLGLHFWPEKERCDYPHNAKYCMSRKLITIRFVYKSACDGPLTYQSSFGKNVDCIAANFNMKAILFVALFGVIASAYAAPKVPVPVTFDVTSEEPIPSSVKCPLRPSVGKEDLLPHPDRPDRCGDYYHCVSGTPKLMHCPDGLHFNPKKNWCDWPWEAECDPAYVTVPPLHFIGIPVWQKVFYRIPAFFVVALFGIIAVAYAGPLTFEATTTEAPVPPSVKCPIPSVGRDDLLPNPNDCGSYYHCVNGVPKLKKCPAATVVLVLIMVAAFAASAPNQPKKRSSAQKSGVKCPTPSSLGKDELLPNPHDCATYYQCAHGTPTLMPCPAGLHFNPREQYCDWPWEAGCDPYFDPKPSSTPKTRTCKAISL